MISGKIIFFLCLIAFWKIVWKIFSNVWSNVKWKKEKIKNPLQMQTHHHNPPQTTIKKPTNPPSQQNPLNQTHRNPPQSTANHHNHEQHRFLAQKHVRLWPPRSPVTYNPSPPSQDHAGRNHHKPKWVADLLLYQADNQTERMWGSMRKRREGRGISARETKDMEGGSRRTEAVGLERKSREREQRGKTVAWNVLENGLRKIFL